MHRPAKQPPRLARLREQGWMSLPEVAKLLGVAEDETLTYTVKKWLRGIGWPGEHFEDGNGGMHYYAPITREQIFRHPEYPAMLKGICGKAWPLVVHSFLNDEFRAGRLAESLSA